VFDEYTGLQSTRWAGFSNHQTLHYIMWLDVTLQISPADITKQWK